MDLAVGATVLLPPLFIDGDLNHDGKRIRVTAEGPSGKYRIFSSDATGTKVLYFLTASGMIDWISEYFPSVWDEGTRLWEGYRPTEAEFDELIRLIAGRFEKTMADPKKWAMYQHAAVLGRIGECEAHNMLFFKLRSAD